MAKRERGFTLVEMLIVVLVVGVVAAVGFTSYIKSMEVQRQTEAQTVSGSIAAAQRIYFLQNGRYDTSSPIGSGSPLVTSHLLANMNWGAECYSYGGANDSAGSRYVVNATRNFANCGGAAAYSGYGVYADKSGVVEPYGGPGEPAAPATSGVGTTGTPIAGGGTTGTPIVGGTGTSGGGTTGTPIVGGGGGGIGLGGGKTGL